MPGDVTRLYRVKYVVEDGTAKGIASIRAAFVGVNLEIDSAVGLANRFGSELDDLKPHLRTLANIQSGFGRIGQSARLASTDLADVGRDVAKIATGSSGIDDLAGSIKVAQRSSYGWKKNLEEANVALAGLTAQSPAVASSAGALGGLAIASGKASGQTVGLSGAMAGFVAKVGALSLATEAAHAFGTAMSDARDFAKDSAAEVIKIRDGLRELANLQGKATVDDETFKGSVRLRQVTGMSDAESRAYQEQYLGSRPLAIAKGNIDQKTADSASEDIARSSVRVGLDARTAGDLAGSIGMFGRIKSADQATGQVQQVIDRLNDGRGNLTPLVKELMKGGAATVGEGNAFRSIPERAAAIQVATGIVGTPGQTSTALGAAIRGLTGFTKKQGDTLEQYGVKSGQDLPTMIEKIAPLIEKAEAAGQNASAAMAAAGFGNKTDRDAIIGLVKNKGVLRSAIESVREAPGSTQKADLAGRRAREKNDQFYGTDKSAAARVSEANLAAGRALRGLENESLEIARKSAEGQLIAERKLDTPGSNFSIKMANLASLSALTGTDARQDQIDARVRDNLRAAGKRAGVAIPRRGSLEFGSDSSARDELNKYGPKIQAAGQNPYGDPVDLGKKLDRIVEVLEKNGVQAPANRALPGPPNVVGERR